MVNEVQILLVEDSHVDAVLFRQAIEMVDEIKGVVVVKTNLQEALEYLKTKAEVDIIFLDLCLPDGYGMKIVSAIYALSPHIPILVLTGQEDPDLMAQVLKHGAQDYLTKGSIRPKTLGRYITSSMIRKHTELELFQKAEEAQEKSKNKSDFLSQMSHEIRTPLNSIVGLAELLQETVEGDENTDYLEALNRSAKSLLSLINDILDMSKIEAGEIELESIPYNLPKLVNEVAEMLKYRASQRSNILLCEINSNVPAIVRGDPVRVRQVLTNLVGNSIKFTKNGEIRINISATKLEDNHFDILFAVRDTGIGIAQSSLNKLFKKFSQVDISTTRKFGGTGLGLAITKNLVELMDGKIWVESEQDRGSSFFFTVRFEELHELKLKKQKYDLGNLEPLDILLVDDSRDNIFLIQAYLKDTPYNLTFAENGKEALEKALKGSFDLILMDMQMPIMDGYQATTKIREWERGNAKLNRVPVIALTASALVEEKTKAIECGCDLHVTKPVTKSILFESIVGLTLKQAKVA